jgi:hypothetical protein
VPIIVQSSYTEVQYDYNITAEARFKKKGEREKEFTAPFGE